MTHEWIWLGWALFLILAWPHAQRFKHKDARPIAAYLIFIMTCSLAASLVFFMGTWAVAQTAAGSEISSWATLLIVVAAVFLAVVAGNYAIRRPPPSEPEEPQ
ncbi:hypothetical protein [Kordiimonas lacus]|uniref:Uncharacterized protein n=1 Tax=Kordiimonas lacus TaxID=637679 RepID=A0A1G7AD68_9PROT|nr:hypothetical protein [Kordiimonas lacus]SDE11975.1 hypothetical protein SAMN04488071_2161 [Kordiimonas lacus]